MSAGRAAHIAGSPPGVTTLDRRMLRPLNLPKNHGAGGCTDLSPTGHDARRERMELETFALVADVVAGVAVVIS